MDKQTLNKIVSLISYKPGWDLITHFSDKRGSGFIQVSCEHGIDAVTHKPVQWRGAKHRISEWMCKQEVVGVCFRAFQEAEMHELREFFRYNGEAIYNPHISPDDLAELLKAKLLRTEARTNPMTMEEDKP